jgi:hypothetical protein
MSRRSRAQTTSLVSCQLEPLDASLVPIWYLPVFAPVRILVRCFVLHVARWRSVRPHVPSRVLRRAESLALAEGLPRSLADAAAHLSQSLGVLLQSAGGAVVRSRNH